MIGNHILRTHSIAFLIFFMPLSLWSADVDESSQDSHQVQDKKQDYAKLWSKGTLPEKKIFISGISVGLNLLTKYSLDNFQIPKDSIVQLDSSCVEKVKSKVKRAYNEVHFSEQGFDEEKVAKMMDGLYKKPKNKNLSFQEAYVAALIELERRISPKR